MHAMNTLRRRKKKRTWDKKTQHAREPYRLPGVLRYTTPMEKAPSARPERIPSEEYRLVKDIFLEVYGGEDSLELQLRKRPGGRVIDRIPLSARSIGYVFKPGEHFQVDQLNKIIYLNPDRIDNDPREIFALLHEMGHAALINKNSALYGLAVGFGRGKWGGVRGAKLMVADERGAWAEGIRIARQLRDEGYDLFQLFPNKENLSRWLRDTGLTSYENEFIRLINETKGEHILGISVEHSHPPKKKKKYS